MDTEDQIEQNKQLKIKGIKDSSESIKSKGHA